MTIAETPVSAPPTEPPPGYWEREASHNPKPLTPLGSSIFVDGLNQSFPKVFSEFGLLIEALEYREIGGYVYNRAKPFGGGDRGGGNLPPKFVLWLFMRLHPAFRRRLAVCKRAVRSRRDLQLAQRWFDEWRPRLIADIAGLRAADLTSMTDAELAAHLEHLNRWTFEAFDIHFFLSAANGWPLARLVFFCRDHLGHDDLQTMRLLSGLSGASSEPAIALADLAGNIRPDAELTKVLLASDAGSVPALVREHGGPHGAKLDHYVDHFGCRALQYEVIEPTLGEQPEIIGRLLQDELRKPFGVAEEQDRLRLEREETKQQALDALANDRLRSDFLQRLEEAQRTYPIREDNEFYTVSVPLALIRFAVLEAAERLLAAATIGRPDDVFFLRIEEVIGALSGDGRAYVDLIGERRRGHAAAEQFDAPASYGTEPPPPPLDVLPPEAREAMSAMLYLREKIFEAEQSGVRAAAGTRELKGRAAARGTYTGTARVIMGEHEFDRLQPGDVLVCPITSPVWSILFGKVAALVTDSGGILSHPAIIAREYGIPAVVATGNATAIIADGARVTVDGDAGTVSLLD